MPMRVTSKAEPPTEQIKTCTTTSMVVMDMKYQFLDMPSNTFSFLSRRRQLNELKNLREHKSVENKSLHDAVVMLL
jgi:hypothetical protein